MDHVTLLRHHGLFDAKVPRYTSYPPANKFLPETGAACQKQWLRGVPADKPISIYVHIPFCRRLCWFCACRTQGVQKFAPVQAYLTALKKEIEIIATDYLPKGVKMGRLHLGGGTPTLLSAAMMDQLLGRIFSHFQPTDDFEFSVEIDPTEAAPDVLEVLSNWTLHRASVGVQDFDLKVQKAIGRLQSYDETAAVVTTLRAQGIKSLNVDLLYGLPHQTQPSLLNTLEQVHSLQPDRLALYGYAHVPHMSKRQVMIPSKSLPDAEQRFFMSEAAKKQLASTGYQALGIDHFARPSDSLAKAAKIGKMRRNFQGYTDDPFETLIGFGASSISKFRQGYLQNAVATSAYNQRIKANGIAAQKGYALTAHDIFSASLIDQIMCFGEIRVKDVRRKFPAYHRELSSIIANLETTFSEVMCVNADTISLRLEYKSLTRIIASHLDQTLQHQNLHSMAV